MSNEFNVKKIIIGSTLTNCYLFWCNKTKISAIIDPGANVKLIKKYLRELDLKPKCIIITHAHFDHIGVINKLELPVYAGSDDAEYFTNPRKNLSLFFSKGETFKRPTELLKEGDKLTIGNCNLEVLEVPGHTPGSICLLTDKILFSGDTLFAGGIGRTDFPNADGELLIEMIKKKLLTLDDDTKVYPGHGKVTTIGEEKRNNPYVA